jgi:hypothetical protein
LAEKYGFVFVGSNVSKNGMPWETTRARVSELMHDVNTRIHIDPKQVYTAGFSGGSRVASSVAIFEGGVAGVMGCAAGFPKIESGITSKFDYVGLVGLYDFNLNEMIQLDQTLEQNKFTHQLIRFNDKHGWADTSSFETALLWLQVHAMKEQRQLKNDTCVNALKHHYDQQIKFRTSTSEWLLVDELLEGAIRALQGMVDVSSYQKQLNVLSQNPNYKKAIDLQQRLQEEELKQQQFFAQQFAQHDVAWWTHTITQFNLKIKQAQSKVEAQMYQRLLNYLGFIAYMNSNHALQINDLNSVNTFLSVFKLADLKNPDVAYLRAIYSMKKMQPEQAMVFLNESAALGYSDLPQLLSEPVFAEMLSKGDFRKVLQKVQLNALHKKE